MPSLSKVGSEMLDGALPALDASSLTSIPAANITGTLPAISGASLTNLPAATSVAFPASQSASADVNTLDDYEEGSWTPTIQDSSLSNSESQVYHGNEIGTYTKIGRCVTCNGAMNINSAGTLTTSDYPRLAGLPFAPRNNGWGDQTACSFTNMGGFSSNIFDLYQVTGAVGEARTYVAMQANTYSNGANNFTIAILSGGFFGFSVTYFV